MSKDLVLSRTFDAPVSALWEAFTKPEMVKQWWGPKGFTCTVANMNVKEGESSLVCMQAPKEWGGMDMYNTWTYTKIEPGKKLEYTLKFTDKDGKAGSPPQPGVPVEVPHTVEFKEEGDKTTVTITEKGYENDQVVEMSRQGMEQCFDKIEAIFKG